MNSILSNLLLAGLLLTLSGCAEFLGASQGLCASIFSTTEDEATSSKHETFQTDSTSFADTPASRDHL